MSDGTVRLCEHGAMGKKIEIACLVLLGCGLLFVASLIVRSYFNSPSVSTKQPVKSYPSTVYAEYQFYRGGGRAKIPVALKISLKNGKPQVMYLKSLAGKRSKLMKVKLKATVNENNYVAHDAKGRNYGFYWDKDNSKIGHSFSYTTKKGQVYFGRSPKMITAQRWRKLVGKTSKSNK